MGLGLLKKITGNNKDREYSKTGRNPERERITQTYIRKRTEKAAEEKAFTTESQRLTTLRGTQRGKAKARAMHENILATEKRQKERGTGLRALTYDLGVASQALGGGGAGFGDDFFGKHPFSLGAQFGAPTKKKDKPKTTRITTNGQTITIKQAKEKKEEQTRNPLEFF